MSPYHNKVKLLEEFKEETFKNAVRLFYDATSLYTHSSYSSSYALAAAAYEEIGKVLVIDHACDDMCLNPDSIDGLYDRHFKSGKIKDHKHKQQVAMYEASRFLASGKKLEKFIDLGGLEQSRQKALYVEMDDNKIRTPNEFTSQKVFELITLCQATFHEMGDIGFSGFWAASTKKSEWLASRELERIDEAMNHCLAHNKEIQP